MDAVKSSVSWFQFFELVRLGVVWRRARIGIEPSRGANWGELSNIKVTAKGDG
jgi:hypothetical protein